MRTANPVSSIGAAGFEPATSCSQSRRATSLRHAPSTGQALRSYTLRMLSWGPCGVQIPKPCAAHEPSDKDSDQRAAAVVESRLWRGLQLRSTPSALGSEASDSSTTSGSGEPPERSPSRNLPVLTSTAAAPHAWAPATSVVMSSPTAAIREIYPHGLSRGPKEGRAWLRKLPFQRVACQGRSPGGTGPMLWA